MNARDVMTKRWSTLALSLAMAALLTACGGAPKKEELTISVSAAEDVNPDLQGRPSPVVLHVLVLKSGEQFNGLDYASLASTTGSALGSDLLSREQVVMAPGTSRALELEIAPEAQSIGLVAGYRDIDNATWRKTVPVSPGGTKSITINLSATQLETTTN